MRINSNIQQKKNIWITFARTLVSIGLLLFLCSQIDLTNFLQVLSGLSIFLLISIPFLFISNVLISTIRWQVLLKNFDIQEKFFKVFFVYFISFFWSNFLPTTIGGDGYRFFEMRKRNSGKDNEILASILLDRVYGFTILCIVHIISTVLFWNVIFQNEKLLLAEALIFSGIGVAYLTWVGRSKVRNKVQSRYLKKILTKIEEIVSVLKKQSWDVIWQACLASLIFILVSSFALQIYYLAAGSSVNYFFATYVNTLSNIIGVLPLSINGIGLVELPQLIAMGTQGISAETVIVVALSIRIMGLLISAVGGVAYLLDSWLSAIFRLHSKKIE